MEKITGPATLGGAGEFPNFFSITKAKKKETKKNKKEFQRLSPRSKCYCFSHSTASRIQKFYFSANHGGQEHFSVLNGSSTLKSISPALESNICPSQKMIIIIIINN